MRKANRRLPQPDTEESSRLKIGEVSKRSGIGIEALRFYEKSGLIDPLGCTSSGYRLYDAGVLDRLEFIKRAQMLGFSLNEIAQIIAEKRAGQSPCAKVREIRNCARSRRVTERFATRRSHLVVLCQYVLRHGQTAWGRTRRRLLPLARIG